MGTDGEARGIDERIAIGRGLVASQIPYFKKAFGCVSSDWKSDGSRVTEADLAISKAVMDGVSLAFPRDQFFSEELDSSTGPETIESEYSWMIDPIDGTNNFARGMPDCSISLAILKNGDPVYGYVYDYGSDRLYHGGLGKGLWVGEDRVERRLESVSDQSLVAVQAHGFEKSIKEVSEIQRNYKIRAIGSSAIQLMQTAFGIADGVVNHRIKSWDIAAGYAMAKEAGLEIVFLDTKVFPATTFDVNMDGFGYMTGSEEMMRRLREIVAVV